MSAKKGAAHDQAHCKKMRYTVTLNAPTVVMKQPEESSISYANLDVVYQLSILDTEPKSDIAQEYCTLVLLSQDFDSSAQITQGKSSLSVIYAPSPQDSGSNSSTQPWLSSSSGNSFSVSWRSNNVTGGSYCLIPLRFECAHGARDTKLKLFTGTERIRVVDTNLAQADGYEESCAHIRLFANGDADAIRVSELSEVAQQLAAVDLATAQASADEDENRLRKRRKDDAQAGFNEVEMRTMQKRKALDPDSVSDTIRKRVSIPGKFSAIIDMPSIARPVQVFCPTTTVQGSSRPMHALWRQTKHSMGAVPVNPCQMKMKKPPLLSNCNSSDAVAILPAMGIEAATLHPVDQPQSAMGTISSIEKSDWTSASNHNRAVSSICFYVRQEQSIGARYTAIYISELTLSKLLDAISMKLQVPVSAIGTISYLDHHSMRVLVDERTIQLLGYEQDLLVWLPWRHSSVQGSSSEGDLAFPDLGSVDFLSTGKQPGNIKTNEAMHLLWHDQPNEFEDLLNYDLEDHSSTATESWAHYGNDSDMLSVSEMFALCSTNTSASPERNHLVGDNLQRQLNLGPQEIDYRSYGFDGASESSPQSMSFSLRPSPSRFPDVGEAPATTIQPAIVGNLPHDTSETLTLNGPPIPLPANYERPLTRKYTSKKKKAQKITSSAPKKAEQEKLYFPPPKERSTSARDALERNRIAASVCRLNRKDREARLQAQSRGEMLRNQQLRAEIQQLEVEVAIVQRMLSEHMDCS